MNNYYHEQEILRSKITKELEECLSSSDFDLFTFLTYIEMAFQKHVFGKDLLEFYFVRSLMERKQNKVEIIKNYKKFGFDKKECKLFLEKLIDNNISIKSTESAEDVDSFITFVIIGAVEARISLKPELFQEEIVQWLISEEELLSLKTKNKQNLIKDGYQELDDELVDKNLKETRTKI